MTNISGIFCPVEECRANRGGYCGGRASMYSFPAMLPAGNIADSVERDSLFPMQVPLLATEIRGFEEQHSAPWRSWQNCPYKHSCRDL